MKFGDDHSPSARNQKPDKGELGEQLVAGWLRSQGWGILYQRWRCRWGEIDLVAQHHVERERQTELLLLNVTNNQQLNSSLTSSPQLAFIEVKTRSRGNWDADGLLSVTPLKQAKLLQAAELFLAEHPELAYLPCRFDVALVSCQPVSERSRQYDLSTSPEVIEKVQFGQPVFVGEYRLILQDYISSAFE
ncbi:MAG TPA: YraN family protein [Coleofasciculaceae cyanobacterium]